MDININVKIELGERTVSLISVFSNMLAAMSSADKYATADYNAIPIEPKGIASKVSLTQKKVASSASNKKLTHDDVRDLMATVINSDPGARAAILAQLKAMNVRSVGSIASEALPELYAFLQTLQIK